MLASAHKELFKKCEINHLTKQSGNHLINNIFPFLKWIYSTLEYDFPQCKTC